MSSNEAVTPSDVIPLPWERKPAPAEETSFADYADNLFEEEHPEGASDATDEPPVEEPESDDDDGDEIDESKPEDGDDDQSDPEEEEEDSEEEPESGEDLHEIKVSGKARKVTLDELKANFSKGEDYTQKTQALANERGSFEQERVQTREARNGYQQGLAALQRLLANATEQEPNWSELRQKNPTEFAVRWAEKQQRDQVAQAVMAEQNRVAQQHQQDFDTSQQERLAAERLKLVEAIPEWVDEKKSAAGRKALKDYAIAEYGYTEDDLGNVTDHRVMVMLRKAMLFDRQLAKGKQIVQDKVQKPEAKKGVLKPGSRGTSSAKGARDKAALRRAEEKLARTGREEDAAEVFKFFIE